MRNITVIGTSVLANPLAFTGSSGTAGLGFFPSGLQIVPIYGRFSQVTGASAGMRFGRSLFWPIKDGGLGATKPISNTVVSGAISGAGSVVGTSAGSVTTNAPANEGRIISGTIAGVGTATASTFGRGNLSGSIVIGFQPSSEDIAFTLLDNFEVEGGLTVRQALRLIAAAAAGNILNPSTNNYVIRNAVEDSKDRITATGDGNVRTITSVDLT